MRIQKPCSTSGLIAYSAGAIDSLWNNGNVAGSYSIAGATRDGSFGWLAKGSALEVFNLKSGHRIAAWCFGALIKDPETLITAVCEYENDRCATSQLVVASTSLSAQVSGGVICLFDVHRSAVVRAIHFPHEVTSLVTVSSSLGADESLSALFCQQLQMFSGIVAVGTQAGHLYLLDMCSDDADVCNELAPRQVQITQPTQSGVAVLEKNTRDKRSHLCIKLAGSTSEEELFNYWYSGANGRPEQCQFKSSEVYVSCLHFVKQTLTLLVGFTFGGFQMWDLATSSLKYSSRYEENTSAVVHFAFQEPENDPRDYCFIWVVYGPTSSDPVKSTLSHASMYQLSYQKKKWVENLGFLYERLASLAMRFSHELRLDPYNSVGDPLCGSRVISCFTLEDHKFRSSPVNANETLSDDGVSPDRSLCVFVWEAIPHDKQASNRCFLAIFDLNRWYHGQMPSSLGYYRNQKTLCPYWAVCSLNEMMQNTSPDLLLMAFVNFSELNRFLSPFNPQSEKFLYPSSLAFTVYCISDNGVIISKFLGIQRLILGYIQKNGFDVLLDPNEICTACVKSGLITTDSPDAKLTSSQQRELLLSMALDYNIVGFVLSCLHQLAKSEFLTEGMTLRTFLEWAWRKLTECKESVDRLCTSLFDWSPVGFTEHDTKQLHHYQVLMQHLLSVFEALNCCSSATTLQGKEETAARLKVVNLVAEYLDIVIWLHAVQLLPEHSEDDLLKRNEFAFPAKALTSAYASRRQSIKQLNSNANPSAVLVIDGLLEAEGVSISRLFEDECGCCFYPPSNFHAVVRMFLLREVSKETKQMVVVYLLLDLAFLTESEETRRQMQEICKQFCCHFRILPNFYRRIQGIWLLDHEQFEQAAVLLIDTSGDDYMGMWQHDFIIRAFLCQGHERLALKYVKLKGIPALTADDIKLRMTVLLANGLTAEALKYQRCHYDGSLMEDLMSHLILACLETNTIGELLNLSLTKEEENHLVQYLKNSNSPTCHRLLIYFYLQQSRVTDAISFSSHRKSESQRGSREKILEAVVEGYKMALPSVQRKMGFNVVGSVHQFPQIYREYSRPMPLSSELHHQQRDQVITRATLLNAVLDKVHQINFPDGHLLNMESAGSEQSHHASVLQNASLFDTPIVPLSVKKSRMSTANDVIFPSSSVIEKSLPNFSKLLDSPQLLTSSVTNRFYSAAALTVLQTPPVRKYRTLLASGEANQRCPTPQLILSTKRLKLSTEASSSSDQPHSVVGGALTLDDTATEYDDQQRRRKARLSPYGVGATDTLRSKTLRFLEPEVADSLEDSLKDLRSHRPEKMQATEIPRDGETSADEMEINEDEGEDEEGEDEEAAVDAHASELSSSLADLRNENTNNSAIPPLPVSMQSSLVDITSLSFSLCQKSARDGTTVWSSSDDMELTEIDAAGEEGQLELSGEMPVESSGLRKSPKEEAQRMSTESVPYGVGGCLLKRPALWEHDLWRKAPFGSSKTEELHGPEATGEDLETSSPMVVCCDVQLQTSLSNGSDDLELEIKETSSSSKNSESNLYEIRKSVAEEFSTQDLRGDRPTVEQLPDVKTSNIDWPRMQAEISPVEHDFEKDKCKSISDDILKSPATRQSIRSPGRDIVDVTRQPMTPTKRSSVWSLGHEASVEPGLENSGDYKRKETVDRPVTPRRSIRSPGREVLDPPPSGDRGEIEKMKDAVNQQNRSTKSTRSPGRETVNKPKTPTRRSTRSPGREALDSQLEKPGDSVVEKETVDQPKTPTRRSTRSPGREVLDSQLEKPGESVVEKETVDQPKTPTRRSTRSPGREAHNAPSENPRENVKENQTVDQPETPVRRSRRSPGRDSSLLENPDGNEKGRIDRRKTRITQSTHSPSSRDSAASCEEEEIENLEKTRMPAKRPVRSPVRDILEPLFEETSDVCKDQINASDRQTAVQIQNLDVFEPSKEKFTEAEDRKDSSVNSRKSPNREIGEKLTEARTVEKESGSVVKSIYSVHNKDSKDKGASEVVEGKTAALVQRRSVRSPSREKTFIDDNSTTPVRRSQRQREKHGREEQDVSGIEAAKSEMLAKESSSDGKSNTIVVSKTGNRSLHNVSKSVVLSNPTTRKPVTRGDTKLIREKELEGVGETASASASSSPSPGRTSKRRSMQREIISETSVGGRVPPSSMAALLVNSSAMENSIYHESVLTKSSEKVERQFVFSAPLLATVSEGYSVKAKESVSSYSDFVFSPPRTQLRDRSFASSTVSEVENVGVEDSKERKTEKSAKNKTGKKTMTKMKATKDKRTPKGKRAASAGTPSADDVVPILLSPLSDAEISPKVSAAAVRKRSTRSSYVTRSKRKKLKSFEPTLFW